MSDLINSCLPFRWLQACSDIVRTINQVSLCSVAEQRKLRPERAEMDNTVTLPQIFSSQFQQFAHITIPRTTRGNEMIIKFLVASIGKREKK